MSKQYPESLIEAMRRACDAVALALVYGKVADIQDANKRLDAVLADYPEAEHKDLWFKAACRIDEKEIALCEALHPEP
jgi:hypothetical protein